MGVRLLKISAKFILSFLADKSGEWSVVDDHLPNDVKLLSLSLDPCLPTTFIAQVESSEWREIDEGLNVPFIKSPSLGRREGLEQR